MDKIACVLCEKELPTGLDQFGPVHAPMCWTCWSSDEWRWEVAAEEKSDADGPYVEAHTVSLYSRP